MPMKDSCVRGKTNLLLLYVWCFPHRCLVYVFSWFWAPKSKEYARLKTKCVYMHISSGYKLYIRISEVLYTFCVRVLRIRWGTNLSTCRVFIRRIDAKVSTSRFICAQINDLFFDFCKCRIVEYFLLLR